MFKSLNTINSEMYLKVAIILAVITIITYLQHLILPLGTQGTVIIQMLIALVKASFIILYYMHLKFESNVFKVLAGISVGILLIFFIIIAIDAYYSHYGIIDAFKE